MMNSTVLAQTSGLEVSASSTSEVKYIPRAGEPDGCSSKPAGGISQLTLGSLSALTSEAKSLGKVGVKAFLYRTDVGLS